MTKPTHYLPFDQEVKPAEFYEHLAKFDPRLPDWATVTDVTIEFNRDDETVFVGLEVTVMPATSRIEEKQVRRIAQEEAANVVSHFADLASKRVEVKE